MPDKLKEISKRPEGTLEELVPYLQECSFIRGKKTRDMEEFETVRERVQAKVREIEDGEMQLGYFKQFIDYRESQVKQPVFEKLCEKYGIKPVIDELLELYGLGDGNGKS